MSSSDKVGWCSARQDEGHDLRLSLRSASGQEQQPHDERYERLDSSAVSPKWLVFCGKGFSVQARRERRAYPEVDLQGVSNEARSEKDCRPLGCAQFGLWLRCSSVTAPLRGMLPPRAWPQAKLGATKHQPFRRHNTSHHHDSNLRAKLSISSPARSKWPSGMERGCRHPRDAVCQAVATRMWAAALHSSTRLDFDTLLP